MNDDSTRVTALLRDWVAGDPRARDELVPIVYGALRRLAARYLADERHAPTLQPTALVHEAYLRLVQQDLPAWEGRSHFYGVAAHVMRQVLVDHARRRLASKRGAGAVRVDLESASELEAPARTPDILALDQALEQLAAVDERKCRVVELRYFTGLTEEEAASALGLSVATVRRDLRAAEAWLAAKLQPSS
jgi:RNA polymerase sigma factor (TIGR02999 family)